MENNSVKYGHSLALEQQVQQNVSLLLDIAANRNPQKVVFIEMGRNDVGGEISRGHIAITYGEFLTSVARLASGFSQFLHTGDRVILLIPMSAALYRIMIALQRLGAIPVFLDSWSRKEHTDRILANINPQAIITNHEIYRYVRNWPIEHKIVLDPQSDDAEAISLANCYADAELAPVPIESEQAALITFTTGTTGDPKGANRTHRFLLAQHRALKRVIPYYESDIDMCVFPIFALNNIALGITTIIPDINIARPHEDDASIIYRQIYENKATTATLSPSLFNRMASYCHETSKQLPPLRRVVTGGAPLGFREMQDFCDIAPQTTIQILYGSTEVEPIAHISAQEILARPTDQDEIIRFGGDVGRIDSELQYRFLRNTDTSSQQDSSGIGPCFVGETDPGEVIVAGEHVCPNYFNNPEADARTKFRDASGTLWHRTGDVGLIDPRGHLRILGRVNNGIRKDGKSYFPVPVELLLQCLPEIERAAYVGIRQTDTVDSVHLVIKCRNIERQPLTIETLQALAARVRALLSQKSIPIDELYFVDEIPVDVRHHSKVEYSLLRQKIIGGELQPFASFLSENA